MKSLNRLAMVLALALVVIACPLVSVADMSELQFDYPGEGDSLGLSGILPFEDCSLSGHSIIIAWMEAFAVSNIAAGLSEDAAIIELLSDDLTLSAMALLSINVCSASGYRLPDAAQIYFADGSDLSCFSQYGQGDLTASVAGVYDWSIGLCNCTVDLTQWPVSPWLGYANPEPFRYGTIFGKMID